MNATRPVPVAVRMRARIARPARGAGDATGRKVSPPSRERLTPPAATSSTRPAPAATMRTGDRAPAPGSTTCQLPPPSWVRRMVPPASCAKPVEASANAAVWMGSGVGMPTDRQVAPASAVSAIDVDPTA